MPISAANAANDTTPLTGTSTSVGHMPPGGGQAMVMQVGFLVVLVVLFYVLMVMPQQRRFKEHRAMVDAMKPGDKVLTAAGFLGKVVSVDTTKGEVVVDLGDGVKVTALRATIQTRIAE